jgi:heme o synthase
MTQPTKLTNYLTLMKPSIMLLVVITGAGALVWQGSLFHNITLLTLIKFAAILVALMLTGGSANAFNMYLEREIDAQMTRTRNRRPLPMGVIKPAHALAFAIGIGVTGVLIFALFFNLLSALLSLATILFYSFFYTLYLKPRTPYNIVIGGAAGSMAPIIAWAAVANSISIESLILFTIIFLWTPPHFWALALYLRKDYETVHYPMMPLVRGDRATKKQIFFYVISLVISSIACVLYGAGLLYFLVAIATGALFIRKSYKMFRGANERARGLFGYSIVYLFAIFAALMLDKAINITL